MFKILFVTKNDSIDFEYDAFRTKIPRHEKGTDRVLEILANVNWMLNAQINKLILFYIGKLFLYICIQCKH